MSGLAKSEQSHIVRLWIAGMTAPRDLMRTWGAVEVACLLGQVVFFLGFDGVMLTVANDHRVQW